MRKITVILFLVVLITGCSVFRYAGSSNEGVSTGIITGDVSERVIKQNITFNSFFIRKAEIEFTTMEGREKFLCSIKFERPDKYLISLKSRTGIEAARIFITKDTILINDRINRKQYYGSTQYLKSKYGITASFIPLIFGDYIEDNISDNNQAKCFEGKMDIDCLVSGIKIKYVIDCKKGKSISATPGDSLNDEGIEIQYDDFFKTGEILTPGKIEIRDFQRQATIEIRIQNIESPWDGSIEFIPGNRYEILQLL